MDTTIPKILVVDDEEDICAIVQYHLSREGYEVDVALSAEEAMKHPLPTYSLFLLDVMMPGLSGFEFAQKLKADAQTRQIPIVFLTAMDTDDHVVEGLTIGADDYISKPFATNVLKARVAAVLRRVHRNYDVAKELHFEGISIDLLQKTLMIDDEPISITRRELEILIFLIQNQGKVFSREAILHEVWPDDVCVTDRTVDVNITRLRKKIGRYSDYITTRIGYGYSFNP